MKQLFRASFRFLVSGLGVITILSAGAAEKLTDLSELSAWRKPAGEWIAASAVSLNPTNAEKLIITSGKGILINGPKAKTVDLISGQEFGDAEIHVEFCVPKHSNSGVYLMGRYEIQV